VSDREVFQLELEVVTLVGGPANGEDVEVPVGYLEIWHCTDDGGYARHERSDPGQRELHWTGEHLAGPAQLADWMVANGYNTRESAPIVHQEGPDGPRAHTAEFIEDDRYSENRPHG
jgi:hypothetical protein